jgi:hypothetical protein
MSLYSSLTQVLAPFAAKINGLLTGWDGTRYSTPGEAVRQQISDLHILIGDEPGTAIDASAIGYGEDSNVEDALDGLNGRLQQHASTIGDLSQLQTENKTDIVSAINEAVQTGSGSGLTPEISTAILNCFHHVAWTSANGLAYYTALRVLLFPVTITVNDNVMSVENADEISSVSKDGMTLILL